MNKLDPLKLKYARLYWAAADAAKAETVATRHQVGAVIITTSGVILPGWNGTAPGTDNCCETGDWIDKEYRFKSGPLVLHAENNAIGKATRQGISLEGAHLYTTRACCISCARMIIPTGISHVFYDENHDDEGMDLLEMAGIAVESKFSQMTKWHREYGTSVPFKLQAQELPTGGLHWDEYPPEVQYFMSELSGRSKMWKPGQEELGPEWVEISKTEFDRMR